MYKDNVRVRLQPQPFKVLALLASRPGQVVTRPTIEKAIWGDETHVDFDIGLNYCIRQIRVALDDDAEAPQYVETLSKRGYRFLGQNETHRLMLAVIPFGNLTGDTEQEYLADGMTEELITQLSRISPERLRLIAFTSAKQELNVDYILEGSVRRACDRIRIAVQLIQVSDQCHLWAEAYDRTLDDVIAVQTDVAERVARSITLQLLPNEVRC